MDTSINPDIVQYIPDKPDQPEAPAQQEEMEQHIRTDAIQSETFGENAVGDFATEHALDNVLREAEVNQEPADVYMPKSVMEDMPGEFTVQHSFHFILHMIQLSVF